MVKSKQILVMVDPSLYEKVKAKSDETGIPYSEIVRRALLNWVTTGEVPPKSPDKPKGGKHKTTK